MKTRKAFYRALRKIAPNYTWHYNRSEIRASKKNSDLNDYKNTFCPLTLMYFHKTKIRKSMTNFQEVGRLLGLSRKDSETIASAADDLNMVMDPDTKEFSKLHPESRKALLRAVGLDNQAKV